MRFQGFGELAGHRTMYAAVEVAKCKVRRMHVRGENDPYRPASKPRLLTSLSL